VARQRRSLVCASRNYISHPHPACRKLGRRPAATPQRQKIHCGLSVSRPSKSIVICPLKQQQRKKRPELDTEMWSRNSEQQTGMSTHLPRQQRPCSFACRGTLCRKYGRSQVWCTHAADDSACRCCIATSLPLPLQVRGSTIAKVGQDQSVVLTRQAKTKSIGGPSEKV
jgi:hypothetical protein